MREIKFRGKRIGDGMWIYGDLIRCDGRAYIFNNGVNPFDASSWYEVITETVGEFTGLGDKSEKEIYEGDILLVKDEQYTFRLDDGSGPIEEANHLSEVIFNVGAFGVAIKENGISYKIGFHSFDKAYYYVGDSEKDFEVIGNIHENPELLK